MSLIQIGNRSGPNDWDPRIDYQRLRHGRLATRLRGALYRLLIGREGWPLTFRPPVGEGPRGASEHLYVHLPFCRQLCPHCPYNKQFYRPEPAARYGAALGHEIDTYLSQEEVPPVHTLYFGGGTPSVTPGLIRDCIDRMRPFMASGVEIGVEVHPADAERGLLEALREMGVNRVSLGVETFRPDLLKLLGRNYSPEQAETALRLAREVGFSCVDANLICAIPGQLPEDTAADVQRCLDVGVDQLSVYTLFTFGYTRLGRRTREGRLSIYGDRSRLRAQRAVARLCRAAGYRRTSPWNYTRPGIAPYSTVTREDYVGFGAGAASKVGGVFWFNTFSVEEYAAQERNRPAIVMETTERFRRFHWLYWRLYSTEIDPTRYRQRFGRELNQDFGALVNTLAVMGMVRRDGLGWRITEFGAIWMHRMQQLFSISYIDDVWSQCQAEAWPTSVTLA